MVKFRKMLAGFIAMAMSASLATVLPLASASATSATFRLGDVNGDGVITGMDSIAITNYIKGNIEVTALQLTAMDVNQDNIIDMADAADILNAIAMGQTSKFETVTKELYTVPADRSLNYWKHSCKSSSATSYSTYAILQATSEIQSVEDEPVLFSEARSKDTIDKDTDACVELEITDYKGNITHASGFIVGENVIATSASCLYGSSGFVKNVTATFYNYANEQTFVYQTSAEYLHIPSLYASGNDNFNYGLIYFNEFTRKNNSSDVLEISSDNGNLADLGIAVSSFFNNSKKILKTVGYTEYDDDNTVRYSSTGNVIPTQDSSNIFHTSASAKGSKKGGMTYYPSEYTVYKSGMLTETIKSCVGIATSGDENNTYGVKVTPYIARFYLKNSNLS